MHVPCRFIDFYEEPQNFFLVLEKVPGGELFDRIIAEGRFVEDEARACVQSLLEALAYCHSKNIVHRDVKPENILFARLQPKDYTVKVKRKPVDRSDCVSSVSSVDHRFMKIGRGISKIVMVNCASTDEFTKFIQCPVCLYS